MNSKFLEEMISQDALDAIRKIANKHFKKLPWACQVKACAYKDQIVIDAVVSQFYVAFSQTELAFLRAGVLPGVKKNEAAAVLTSVAGKGIIRALNRIVSEALSE